MQQWQFHVEMKGGFKWDKEECQANMRVVPFYLSRIWYLYIICIFDTVFLLFQRQFLGEMFRIELVGK